jgi:hypothetical protein
VPSIFVGSDTMRKSQLDQWKFPIVMGGVTTFFVTFVLVAVNYGFRHGFFPVWMRSWLIAGSLVAMSIRFVGPVIRRWLGQ